MRTRTIGVQFNKLKMAINIRFRKVRLLMAKLLVSNLV